ncbi:hypothetical protein LCI18_003421 [Fusarium solani-melongenae]|uniref:Uncharacterized protein n=1 Tax=Fusarium solani subsp. cucurbitae TaxID=2747967 RepID=A0ACD3YU66_FUSSC|nr:hypothetical protein LCI18_003421 [Fusarium solani-melongenae]
MDGHDPATSHYAILIGIDAYPSNPLRSCVGDVDTIKTLLQRRLVRSVHIQSLTASEEPDARGDMKTKDPELEHGWPTSRNVALAFEKVKSKAMPGDFVYIHYCGHGTRMKPCWDLSNKSTGDLALVLLKGDQSPDMYLRGPKLAGLLKGMTDKGLVVALVLDCCFSASVYRDSNTGAHVRFLPDDFPGDLDPSTYPQDPVNDLMDSATRSGNRDGPMQDNWLMDPDRYTILAACGPQEMKSCTGLYHISYQSLSEHRLTRRHKHIHRHICATFWQQYVPQNPVLYGNGEQGFFGKVVQGGGTRTVCVVKRAEMIQLLAGRAHGLREGDRFTLAPSTSMDNSVAKGAYVAEIVQVGPLRSGLRLFDVTHNIQSGWVAEPLTSSHLINFCFQLAPDLPCYDALLEALRDRSFGIHVPVSQPQAVRTVQVTLGPNNEYEILHSSVQDGFNIPAVQRSEAEVQTICDTLEHLARFRMVKDLINKAPLAAFQEEFQVHMRQEDRSFEPSEQIKARHGRPLQVVIKNAGRSVIYAHNISGGSHIPIPPESDPKDTQTGKCTGSYTGKIKMKVPLVLQTNGSCMDIIKIFVTSQATSFHLLELPNLHELLKKESGERLSDTYKQGMEDWVAFDIFIRTSM